MSNAYISSFAYCREINTIDDALGGVTQIVLLPCLNLNMLLEPTSLKAVCVIAGIDFNQDNSLDIYFIDPDENILTKYSHTVFLEIIKKYSSQIPEAISLQINLATGFTMTGIYTTKIVFNNECIGTFKINIKESAPHD